MDASINTRPNDGGPHADRTFSLAAFHRMSLIRAFEQSCLDLSTSTPPSVIGSVHLCAGQEAVPVGACAALDERDRVVATYRGHGWALEAGLTPFEVMSEICHRATGINGGRAGSPYFMAPDRRFHGENSIVGAGVPIANGVAMGLVHRGDGGVVVVSFGDGAMNQGALHEGLVFAVARRLPVIFVCENNGWSELTPTSRIVPFTRLSRRASGYGMPGATIDGCDPVAVRDTIAISVERARAGEGPSFIECNTVRLWGHYNRDIEHYRPKDDRAEAERREPIAALRRKIIENGLADAGELDALQAEAQLEVDACTRDALASPRPNTASARADVVGLPEQPEVASWDSAPSGSVSYQQALNEALRAELAARPEARLFGEDVGQSGGIFGVSRNLQREFGEDRVFDTPIAEAAILGAAVGGATMGLRPIVEIMWMDFLMVALDQLVNQAANVRYVTGGRTTVPLTVRVQQGATLGSCSQHSQSLEALLAHIPGLKVGLPSTVEDAYDMLRAAVADPDPCVIIEARSLYQTKGELRGERTAVGTGRLRCEGADIALVAWGTAANLCETAAETLRKDGIAAAALDLRWLSPLDEDLLRETVRAAGGRALVVHEANRTGGFGAEIVARLHEAGFRAVGRLGAPDIRIPAAPELQRALLPDVDAIVAAARAVIGADAN